MRIIIHPTGFALWLSANDTYNWATKPGAYWPCSELRSKRCMVVFDGNGLCDLTVNGRRASDNLSCDEVSAIVADTMRDRLPKDHPCWFVAVGQFEPKAALTRHT